MRSTRRRVSRLAPVTDTGAAEEIAAEQRHVDRVYARLEVIKRETAEIEAAGYQIAAAGPPGSLVERDAMVYHAARRRRILDAEHEGLVFGRLDLRGASPDPTSPATGEVRYVGRIGLRDADAHALVIDWRAPAAACSWSGRPRCSSPTSPGCCRRWARTT